MLDMFLESTSVDLFLEKQVLESIDDYYGIKIKTDQQNLFETTWETEFDTFQLIASLRRDQVNVEGKGRVIGKMWYVTFSSGLGGHGRSNNTRSIVTDTFRMYGSVAKSLLELIKRKKPRGIFFTPTDETKRSIYDKLCKMAETEAGYVYVTKGISNRQGTFLLMSKDYFEAWNKFLAQ
jgi:hypothetical protein